MSALFHGATIMNTRHQHKKVSTLRVKYITSGRDIVISGPEILSTLVDSPNKYNDPSKRTRIRMTLISTVKREQRH